MDRINKYKNCIVVGGALFLIFCAFFLMENLYCRFPFGKEKVVTIGVFSDSYWEVQNGYSYRILEDAIAMFEKENPGDRKSVV